MTLVAARPARRRGPGGHVLANGCPKVRWPNPTSAWFVADLSAARDGRVHVAYPCADPACAGWHTATSFCGPSIAGHGIGPNATGWAS